MEKDIRIAVIGLGYVGLPLFCLISNHFTCKGLDNDSNRISLLKEGIDNRECEKRRNIIFALQRGMLTSLYSDIKIVIYISYVFKLVLMNIMNQILPL